MKKLIAANWKMYKTMAEAYNCACDLTKIVGDNMADRRDIVVFTPFTSILAVRDAFKNNDNFFIGGQNFYPAEEGAFTGEISLNMILDVGATWVLIGHSERRHILGETNDLIKLKMEHAFAKQFNIVFCIGETLAEREAGKLEQVLRKQLESAFLDLANKITDDKQIVIAYEPVWAIGTGKVASSDDILNAHAMVRKILKEILPIHGNVIRILYGGSVKADNASSILNLDNVDGVLVGGASLEADKFSKIVLA